MLMKRPIFFLFIGVCSFTMVYGTVSLSRAQTEKLDPPEFFSELALDLANKLIAQGTKLLESGDLEGAIAKFDEINEKVSSKWLSEYLAACAYGRTGHEKKAVEKLELMVSKGFDYPEKLESDPDFELLRNAPGFEKLIERARLNYENGTAAFSRGLPDYDPATDEFESEEELNKWVRQQDRLHYLHRNVWTATELLTAQVDMRARYLAALKALKSGDPDFDFGLERVRASARLKNLSRPGWGVVADLVKHEVDTYAQSSPAAGPLGEAYFFAGLVLSLKYKHDDSRRVDAYDRASDYLGKIDEQNQYYGPAQVLKLLNGFKSPGADEVVIGRKLRDVIGAYPGDANIYTIISTRLNHDAAHVLWPIPLEVPDIDGKDVSLDEYRGKVVLIDFWAITCIPCRKELPNLVEVYNEHHVEGFEIISVCLDSMDRTTLQDLRKWIGDNKMDWRHVYDGSGWKSELAKSFFIGTIPAPYLLGADGSLIAWGRTCRGENLALSVREALSARTD